MNIFLFLLPTIALLKLTRNVAAGGSSAKCVVIEEQTIPILLNFDTKLANEKAKIKENFQEIAASNLELSRAETRNLMVDNFYMICFPKINEILTETLTDLGALVELSFDDIVEVISIDNLKYTDYPDNMKCISTALIHLGTLQNLIDELNETTAELTMDRDK